MAQPRWEDLPEECWEAVFVRLKNRDHHRRHYQHFESLSLVCKQFHSISNRLHTELKVPGPLSLSSRTVSLLVRRFHQLNRIDLVEFRGDLDQVFVVIARSGLNLQELNISEQYMIPVDGMKELGVKMRNTMKILICARLSILRDKDLVVITDSFPYLEELDISYPKQVFRSLPKSGSDNIQTGFRSFTRSFSESLIDADIVALSSKLGSLRKINISGVSFLSDNSIHALSSNCVSLTEIAAPNSILMKNEVIRAVIFNCHQLVSLVADANKVLSVNASPTQSSLPIESSVFSSRALSILDFSQVHISDDFLSSFREANLPLKKLALSFCHGFTIEGIYSFLCAYESLNYLDLQGAKFLTDQSVTVFSQYLHSLTFISLNSCSSLTNSTFLTIAKSCPYLQEFRMEGTNLGKDELPIEFSGRNLAIGTLKLAWNHNLDDITLKRIGFVCPKLETIDVSRCLGITEHGIHDIGKQCPGIREIKMVGCRRICDFFITPSSSSNEFYKLEVLNAMGSAINDAGLSRIGCNCSGLEVLDLEGCFSVTEKGVKEVVEKCKRLRNLSLKSCSKVSVDILNWIVFSRPSLSKVIPPSGFIPGEKQRNLFLRHGCMVSNG